MALSQRVVFTSYAYSGSADQNSQAYGKAHSLPSQLTKISAAPSGILAGPSNNIAINSVITLLPTGLTQQAKIYYCADSVTTLNTNGS